MARDDIDNDESLLDDLPEVPEEELEKVLGKQDEPTPNFSADEPEEDEPEKLKPAEADPELLFAEDEPEPKKAQDDEDLELRDRIFREKRARFEEVARVEGEREEAVTRAMKADLRAADAELKGIERDLAQAQADLETAQEKGESKKVAEIVGSMSDLSGRKHLLAKEKAQAAAEVDKREKNPPNPSATAWTRLNPWYNDRDRYSTPRYEKMRRAAADVDAELYQEKRLDPRTPDYFRELDRRVRAKIPDAFGKKTRAPEDNRQAPREQQRGPAPVRPSPSGGGQGNGRITLGPAQQKAMREMHLDPGNKAHVAAWVRAVRDEQKRTSK